MPKVLQSSTI